MTIEKQVCTLEQAKRLAELGIEQKGLFKYAYDHLNERMFKTIFPYDESISFSECWSAFTVAELGVMLPAYLNENEDDRSWLNCYLTGNDLKDGWETNYKSVLNDFCDILLPKYATEAAARAEMLIYLLEKKLITAEKVNKRLNA